jgi:hypothetical protein
MTTLLKKLRGLADDEDNARINEILETVRSASFDSPLTMADNQLG